MSGVFWSGWLQKMLMSDYPPHWYLCGMVVSSLGALLDIGVPQGTSTQCMVVYNVKGC